jgi:hypothetical protein
MGIITMIIVAEVDDSAQGEDISMMTSLLLTMTRGGGGGIVGRYLFNVYFNISNKKVLNALPLPWTVSHPSLFIGTTNDIMW